MRRSLLLLVVVTIAAGCGGTQKKPLVRMSPREIEVLTLVARGSRNRDVAETLHIGENTVKNHLNAIFIKLDAQDRTEAVTIALARGIISLE